LLNIRGPTFKGREREKEKEGGKNRKERGRRKGERS